MGLVLFLKSIFKSTDANQLSSKVNGYPIDDMPTQIMEILESIRDLYVSHYVATVRNFSDEKALSETILLDKNGKAIGDGALNLPMRTDAFITGKGMFHIPSAQQLSFKDFQLVQSGTTVNITSFVWDNVSIIADITLSKVFRERLIVWFKKAFKEDIESGNGTALNCVHYMSDPKVFGDSLRFEVDFGTAEVSEFLHLLNLLIEGGASNVTVSGIREDN